MVQLKSRHWTITDANGKVSNVRYAGKPVCIQPEPCRTHGSHRSPESSPLCTQASASHMHFTAGTVVPAAGVDHQTKRGCLPLNSKACVVYTVWYSVQPPVLYTVLPARSTACMKAHMDVKFCCTCAAVKAS